MTHLFHCFLLSLVTVLCFVTQVRLKEIFLAKFGHTFTLDKYPLLQDPVSLLLYVRPIDLPTF